MNVFAGKKINAIAALGSLLTQGAFLVMNNRVINRQNILGRSLRSFARTAHSAHSLRSAPLRSARFATLASLRLLRYARFATLALLARSVHGLAHSLRSLPRGTVEILEYVFTL